ncbi:hypothetical protein ACJX0J_009014, partial [Zea mays]
LFGAQHEVSQEQKSKSDSCAFLSPYCHSLRVLSDTTPAGISSRISLIFFDGQKKKKDSEKIFTLDMVSMHLQEVKLTLSIVIWRLSGLHDIYVWIVSFLKSLLSLYEDALVLYYAIYVIFCFPNLVSQINFE